MDGGNPTNLTALQAAAIKKMTERQYVGRIVRVPWTVVHSLIGVASHVAWDILSDRYQSVRVPFAEHKKLTGEIMKKWCWEIVKTLKNYLKSQMRSVGQLSPEQLFAEYAKKGGKVATVGLVAVP